MFGLVNEPPVTARVTQGEFEAFVIEWLSGDMGGLNDLCFIVSNVPLRERHLTWASHWDEAQTLHGIKTMYPRESAHGFMVAHYRRVM